MKLKLTGAGFANYTGQMGVVYFENGLSLHDVHPNDAIRIAGAIGAEWENGAPANVGDIYTKNLNTPAPSIQQQSGLQALQHTVGAKSADDAMLTSNAVARAQMRRSDPDIKVTEDEKVITTESVATQTTPSVKHTSESLAEVADKEGIIGLREIAKLYDVTGNSIALLIERILERQG